MMPLPPAQLSAMATKAAKDSRARVETVPSAGPTDDSVEDALSAIGEFVELSISKVRGKERRA